MNSAPQLDHILETWSEWRCGIKQRPQVVSRLSNGLVSQCWQVASASRYFAVRFSSDSIEQINCRWEEELQAAELAAQLGIGPEVVYASATAKVMVLEWGGAVASKEQIGSELRLIQLAEALRLLHQTPAELNTPGYQQTLELYAQKISRDSSVAPSQKQLDYARYLDKQSKYLVFCHHDLSIGNVLLQQDRIQLIDWEYARIGHALFDLASLIHSAGLSKRQTHLLLDGYGAPGEFIDELPPMLELIEYLGQLWEAALGR